MKQNKNKKKQPLISPSESAGGNKATSKANDAAEFVTGAMPRCLTAHVILFLFAASARPLSCGWAAVI